MCHAQVIRFICDCQRISGVDFCKYHLEDGHQVCARKLTSTIVDQIQACHNCQADRMSRKDRSRLPPGQVLHAHLCKQGQRLSDLAKAYEAIGKQFHRIPLAIRHDPRLRESQRRVYLPIFHATVKPEANSWFGPWHAAVRDYNVARVEASRSLEVGERYYLHARLHTEVAEARMMAARQFVTRANDLWRLMPKHQNSVGDLYQVDIYIRRWLCSLTFV